MPIVTRPPYFSKRPVGAATIVIVMMLFLIMALMAAYANRSLLFEQRMAGSYVRAGLAQEAAEAGVEWTLAQLNGGAINHSCVPVTSGGRRFADRYLRIDAADRRITAGSHGEVTGNIDCARDLTHGGWSCRCSNADANQTPRTPLAGTALAPSFGVNLYAQWPGLRSGTLRANVLGCSDSDLGRCQEPDLAIVNQGQLAKAQASVLIGLIGAVRSPPSAPLVVKGDIASTGDGRLGLHNPDARSAGTLLAAGGHWTGRVDTRLESVPGSAVSAALVQENVGSLSAPNADVFKMFMGASAARYQTHPALRMLTCNGDCSADLEAAYNSGQRIIWVQGALTISNNKTFGTLGDPLLIIASGNVAISGPFQLNGMLVSQGSLDWSNGSTMPSVVNGIVLVGGNMSTDGRMDIVYQQTVANQLRNRIGSYVRVPGSWDDPL